MASVAAPRRIARVREQATALTVASWVVLVVVAHVWGKVLADAGRVIHLHAPPLVGWVQPRISWRLALPVGVGAALIAGLPGAARTLPWRRLLVVVALAAAAWAVVLALTDGTQGLIQGMVNRGDEYVQEVGRVGSPASFLAHFTQRIGGYTTHVRSHPPGFVLALWGLDRAGLGGAGWAAALCIAAGSLAAPLVLVALREVSSEGFARAAAPFVAVAPAAIWIATSADAFFAGVGAAAVTAIVLATGRNGRRADRLAFGGGLLLGTALMLSYGLVLLAVLPAGVAWHRRRLRVVVLAGAGALAVLLAAAAFGFSWLAGLAATRQQYAASVAHTRPYAYFVVADLAALALAAGPAVAVALTRLRDRGARLLVGGAAVAVLAADVSGMSKGEVERIWLPFTVWLLAAAGVLAWRRPIAAARGWLAVQVVPAVLRQGFVRTRW